MVRANQTKIEEYIKELEDTIKDYQEDGNTDLDYIAGYKGAIYDLKTYIDDDTSPKTADFSFTLDFDLEDFSKGVESIVKDITDSPLLKSVRDYADLAKKASEAYPSDPRAQDEKSAHEASVKNGFWDTVPDNEDDFLPYIGNKLLLLVGEIIEAHEEIREGHPVDEIYYPTNSEDSTSFRDSKGVTHKPEGFLVELADLSIRLDDLAGFLTKEFGTPPLYKVKDEKRTFNLTRGNKHGKKF